MALVCVLFTGGLGPSTHHMGRLGARFEATHTKGLTLCLLRKHFLLRLGHPEHRLVTLGSTADTATPITIQLETSFHVPLHSLRQPTLTQSVSHLKRDYLMAQLHQIVEHRDIHTLQLPVKQMTLHHINRRMPLLLLPYQLMPIQHIIILLIRLITLTPRTLTCLMDTRFLCQRLLTQTRRYIRRRHHLLILL